MNAAIEIHDSELTTISSTRDGVLIRLAQAYIHRSLARPGLDVGSVWTQSVEMLFASGVVEGHLPHLPCTLDDGTISGGAEFQNLIPLPCVVETAVRIEARSLHGELVVIRGTRLEVKAIGDASFVEEFPGVNSQRR